MSSHFNVTDLHMTCIVQVIILLLLLLYISQVKPALLLVDQAFCIIKYGPLDFLEYFPP